KPDPEHHTGDDVGVGGTDAHSLQRQNHQQPQPGYGEAAVIQAAGVEQGDDEHRDNVIDDRQRQQKYPYVGWNGTAQQGQQANRKGNIGGGRHGPSVLPDVIHIQAQVEQGRQDHAAGSSGDGQNGLAQIAQRAFMDLAADFHADHQEKDRKST